MSKVVMQIVFVKNPIFAFDQVMKNNNFIGKFCKKKIEKTISTIYSIKFFAMKLIFLTFMVTQ